MFVLFAIPGYFAVALNYKNQVEPRDSMSEKTDVTQQEVPLVREHYFFIDMLRSVACCFVVLHHCLLYFPTSSWAVFYITHLKYFFLTVPLYLMISGFIHNAKISEKNEAYWPYVKSKFKRIMVPYFAISLITLTLRIFLEKSHLMALDLSQETSLLWGQALLRLFFSGIEGHYYFLEILFLYLMIFPIFIRKIKKTSTTLMVFLVIIVFDFIVFNFYHLAPAKHWSPINLLVSAVAGVKFFFFGFLLSRYYAFLKPFLLKYGVFLVPSLLFLAGALLSVIPDGKEYWMFFEILAYFTFALVFFNRRFDLFSKISSLSFGIYLLHQPYFIKISRLIMSLIHTDENIIFVATFILTILLAGGVVEMISHSSILSTIILGTKPARELKK